MDRLKELYGPREANAILRLVAESRFGLSQTDVLLGRMEHLPEEQKKEWQEILKQLHEGRPVQYVLGQAEFLGRPFRVTPEVLIPRPETEELVRLILSFFPENSRASALDLCTGSGCIAVTLALSGMDVTATDVSRGALAVARENAETLEANVTFREEDLLSSPAYESGLFDLVVSNPPYVRESEKREMAPHVLDHEPSLALFVPDDDPLRFYHAVARVARTSLRPRGILALEINRALSKEVAAMLEKHGFTDISIHEDQFHNPRFVFAKA